jgi:hypothetical protein
MAAPWGSGSMGTPEPLWNLENGDMFSARSESWGQRKRPRGDDLVARGMLIVQNALANGPCPRGKVAGEAERTTPSSGGSRIMTLHSGGPHVCAPAAAKGEQKAVSR